MWNFNGFGSSKAQIIKQTGCEFFDKILERNDLICFPETWRDPIDILLFNLNDHFPEFHEPGCKIHLGGADHPGVSFSLYANQFLKMFPLFFRIAIIYGANVTNTDLVGNTIYSSVSFTFPQAVQLY